MEDVMQSLWMLIDVALVSIPYYIFMVIAQMPLLCLLYSAGTITWWYRYSLQRSANEIEQESHELCNR
jgi:hypothetical protein